MSECRKEDRCRGGCCKEFYLRVSLRELKVMYDLEVSSGVENKYVRDIKTVYPMLIDRDELGDSNGNPLGYQNHRYECRNLQPNGDCGIYEKRPWMCRSFPNDRPCPNADCTWSLGQLGMWPGFTPFSTDMESEL